ncbi:uncharacterized protein K460DRAFT_408572 [Cucurbitaria berberidis CBS 394.84]|uniref:SRR1-like domain-containing protein n=1 Tax=Cucurbitaria berberidis CBS 394.84 TaxID=1168544 RepID=A0A9P4L6S7_9PLEO|nr:uncharacterized protein K460DRAFT_408572 [Cucurbitaria berberidis CBS 394.84]KAF1844281.1 hypothetical protein K460DRAFT_408572 [Cucurbitaria berberidis CBS 394.84]
MAGQTEICKTSANADSQLQGREQYLNEIIVELDPIVEAESKHGPVFRRELFDVAYATYRSIEDNHSKASDIVIDRRGNKFLREKITLLDIYGKERKVRIQADGKCIKYNGQPCMSKRVWAYKCIQSLGQAYNCGEDLCPFNFGVHIIQTEAKDCFKVEDMTAKAGIWAEEWKKSEIYSRLTAFLEEHAGKRMQRVDKILCFGLGCFRTELGRETKRPYVQHLAACLVRDIIARQQGGETPKIYAQDPNYGPTGIAYIKAQFDMETLDDPEGFKALDGNTFVLCVAPNVPVRQIAFGMTHEFGGPAGLFCNSIQSEGLECNGKSCDIRSGSFTPYSLCESSPALWKYKQESTWMEYDDGSEEDCFGDVGVYLKQRG